MFFQEIEADAFVFAGGAQKFARDRWSFAALPTSKGKECAAGELDNHETGENRGQTKDVHPRRIRQRRLVAQGRDERRAVFGECFTSRSRVFYRMSFRGLILSA